MSRITNTPVEGPEKKKKKEEEKRRKKRGMVEQRKIDTLVISKFDGQLPKNVGLGAKGSLDTIANVL